MKIRVENSYSDGHESMFQYTVPDMDIPKQRNLSFDDWLDIIWDALHRYTGDGHGQDSDLGWFYSIDILDADDPELVGKHWENSGN